MANARKRVIVLAISTLAIGRPLPTLPVDCAKKPDDASQPPRLVHGFSRLSGWPTARFANIRGSCALGYDGCMTFGVGVEEDP
jgi:hypothetical protein